jgi:hypothetical protein
MRTLDPNLHCSARPHAFFATFAAMLAVAIASPTPASFATTMTITVPGHSNPWLAGMPDGSVGGNGYDHAPAQSPVQVPVAVTGGEAFTFSATGNVAHGGVDVTGTGPEGFTNAVFSRTTGPENGMADISSPIDALIGVFLDANVPSLSSPPSALDFSTAAERDFLTLSPGLRQPFYIGNGLTSLSAVQDFIAPAGATRLFLGTMDGEHWSDNVGSFTVTVTTPEPSSLILAVIGASALLCAARRRSGRHH